MQPEKLSVLTEETFGALEEVGQHLSEGAVHDDFALGEHRLLNLAASHFRAGSDLLPGSKLRGEDAEREYIAIAIAVSGADGPQSLGSVRDTIFSTNQLIESAKQVVAEEPCVELGPSTIIGRQYSVGKVVQEPIPSPIMAASISELGKTTFSLEDEHDRSLESVSFGTFYKGGFVVYSSKLQDAVRALHGDTTDLGQVKTEMLVGLSAIRRKIGDLVGTDPVTAAIIAEVSGIDVNEAHEIFGSIQLRRFAEDLTAASAYILLSTLKPLSPDDTDEDRLRTSDTEDPHKSGDDLTAYRLRLRQQLPEIPEPYIDLAMQMYKRRFPEYSEDAPTDTVSIIGIDYDAIYQAALSQVEELTKKFPLIIGLIGGYTLPFAGVEVAHTPDRMLKPQFPATTDRTHVKDNVDPSWT